MATKQRVALKKPTKWQARLKPKPLNENQRAVLASGRIPLADMALPKRAKFRELIKLAFRRIMDAEIGPTAASLAYYALLSLFPILITVGNLLPFFGLRFESVSTYLSQVIPKDIMNWLNPLIENLLNSTSGGILSIGAITTLWAAGLGINGLKNGFNKAYGVSGPQNYLVSRLLSMLMTFVLVIALGTVMIAFAFGRQFLEWLGPIIGLSDTWLNTFNALRWPVTLTAMVVVICALDYLLPSVRVKFWTILPGAAFTIAGWLVVTQAFSLYMRYFGTRFNSYGTLGTFLVLLLWLDFSATVILIGAVINSLTAEYYTGRIHHSHGKVREFVHKHRGQHVNAVRK